MTEQAAPAGFRAWAIVELMGHVTLAGFVSEADIGGGKLMKIDCPPSKGAQPFTSYFGSASVYKLTPVDEETVRTICEESEQQPFSSWELQKAFRAKFDAAKDRIKEQAREEVRRELEHKTTEDDRDLRDIHADDDDDPLQHPDDDPNDFDR